MQIEQVTKDTAEETFQFVPLGGDPKQHFPSLYADLDNKNRLFKW